MYSPPDEDTAARMVAALAEGARHFDTDTSGPYAWGWNGRTISRRAGTGAWLRVAAGPEHKMSRADGQGFAGAEALIPDTVPRPRLLDSTGWAKDGYGYEAALSSCVPHPVISPSTPELTADPT